MARQASKEPSLPKLYGVGRVLSHPNWHWVIRVGTSERVALSSCSVQSAFGLYATKRAASEAMRAYAKRMRITLVDQGDS